ncbi:hypothetical protein PCASD_04948 [Puccinia coronata f. sp. avenae]|uniref:Uncharacterized protein n=1 Tax=Puccinia coronata f. sp. avenae TaxID=200324 RepID=A0A2N5VD54_9BASI|nr:hypothetical protein PCASD_04948 [Puccinia coronata f. sp. avenae]
MPATGNSSKAVYSLDSNMKVTGFAIMTILFSVLASIIAPRGPAVEPISDQEWTWVDKSSDTEGSLVRENYQQMGYTIGQCPNSHCLLQGNQVKLP